MSSARDRIRLNVGGQRFETTKLTLSRLDGTIFKTMLEDRWNSTVTDEQGDPDKKDKQQQQLEEEIFIDRDPTHFRTILNFLRDGTVVLPSGEREIEELQRETEFYGIGELLEACRSQNAEIKVGDTVGWRPEAVELYWRGFVRFWVDDSLVLPFAYERNGHTFARCIACTEIQDPKCSYTFEIVEEHWKGMSHFMQHITGTVTQLIGKTCCVLKWNNTGRLMHIPLTALRKIVPKSSK